MKIIRLYIYYEVFFFPERCTANSCQPCTGFLGSSCVAGNPPPKTGDKADSRHLSVRSSGQNVQWITEHEGSEVKAITRE